MADFAGVPSSVEKGNPGRGAGRQRAVARRAPANGAVTRRATRQHRDVQTASRSAAGRYSRRCRVCSWSEPKCLSRSALRPVFAPPGTRWQSRKRRGPAFLLSRVRSRAPKPARAKSWVPPADATAIVSQLPVSGGTHRVREVAAPLPVFRRQNPHQQPSMEDCENHRKNSKFECYGLIASTDTVWRYNQAVRIGIPELHSRSPASLIPARVKASLKASNIGHG